MAIDLNACISLSMNLMPFSVYHFTSLEFSISVPFMGFGWEVTLSGF